jgi:hypothetical protein
LVDDGDLYSPWWSKGPLMRASRREESGHWPPPKGTRRRSHRSRVERRLSGRHHHGR